MLLFWRLLMSWRFVFFFVNPQIRKLRRELDASQEKVSALTTQLSANVRPQALKNMQTQAVEEHLSKLSKGLKKPFYYI